jgi:hypothetical protein
MSGDSFVFYRSFATAAKKMPDQVRLSLYDAIVAYCFDETLPELSDVADMAWDLIKPQLDANKKRREDGSKGGRPKTNHESQEKPLVSETENQWLSIEKPNVNVNGNVNVNENGNGNGITTTIDQNIFSKIIEAGIDRDWLEGKFSFVQFSEEYINTEYPDKEPPELKRILIKAVTTPWDNLRQEYPAWREKKQQQAEAAENKRRIERARDSPPQKCQCGGNLESRGGYLVCDSCNGFYSFEQEYIFNESYSVGLKDELKRLGNEGAA